MNKFIKIQNELWNIDQILNISELDVVEEKPTDRGMIDTLSYNTVREYHYICLTLINETKYKIIFEDTKTRDEEYNRIKKYWKLKVNNETNI